MTAPTRHGDWMMTVSGRTFWPLDPRAEEIAIEDIAHSLAHQCRYAGHTRAFYSVAQHSVLVAQHLPPELQLWGLLHDASEAYLVDLPRPVKRHLPLYDVAEDRVMRCVAHRFNLPWPCPPQVKRVDNAILTDEMRQLMPRLPEGMRTGLGIVIHPQKPKRARAEFLSMANRLLAEVAA